MLRVQVLKTARMLYPMNHLLGPYIECLIVNKEFFTQLQQDHSHPLPALCANDSCRGQKGVSTVRSTEPMERKEQAWRAVSPVDLGP